MSPRPKLCLMPTSQTVAALIQTDGFGDSIISRVFFDSFGLSVIAHRAMCVSSKRFKIMPAAPAVRSLPR